MKNGAEKEKTIEKMHHFKNIYFVQFLSFLLISLEKLKKYSQKREATDKECKAIE